MNYLIQKVIVEDGEEYITSLDSEKEFDLVMAYLQRDMLTQVKEKLHKDTADTTEEQKLLLENFERCPCKLYDHTRNGGFPVCKT